MEPTISHRRLPIPEALRSALGIEDPKPAATRRLYMASEHILLMLAHAAQHFVQVLEQRDRTNTSATAMRQFFDDLMHDGLTEIDGKAMMQMPAGYMNEKYGEWVEVVPALNGWIDCLYRIAPGLPSTALQAIRDAIAADQDLGEYLVMAARLEFEAHVDHMKTMRPSEINAAVDATRAEWRKEEMEKTMNTNTETTPVNAAHELLMRAKDAMSSTDVARDLNGTKKPNKVQIKAAEKLLKELNGLGLIEAEARAGGVPFYSLIVVQAEKPAAEVGDMNVVELIADAEPQERVLTPGAQAERAQFVAEYGSEGNCTCFTGAAPCASCTHPGNPLNQEEDETAWMAASDSEGGEADAPAIAPAIMQAITEDAAADQEADSAGWTPWTATIDSVCPVPDGTLTKICWSDGNEHESGKPEVLRWDTSCPSGGLKIIGYKILKQAKGDFATTPELQYLEKDDYKLPPADPVMLAAANREMGQQLEALRERIEKSVQEHAKEVSQASAILDDICFEPFSTCLIEHAKVARDAFKLKVAEVEDLRGRHDAITQQSIVDTVTLTDMNKELSEEVARLHKELASERHTVQELKAKLNAAGVSKPTRYVIETAGMPPIYRNSADSATREVISIAKRLKKPASVSAIVKIGVARPKEAVMVEYKAA